MAQRADLRDGGEDIDVCGDLQSDLGTGVAHSSVDQCPQVVHPDGQDVADLLGLAGTRVAGWRAGGGEHPQPGAGVGQSDRTAEVQRGLSARHKRADRIDTEVAGGVHATDPAGGENVEQPRSGGDPVWTGLQRDWCHVEQHPVKRGREVVAGPHAHAFPRPEVKHEFHAGRPVGEVIEDLRVGGLDVRMDGASPNVPLPIHTRCGRGASQQRVEAGEAVLVVGGGHIVGGVQRLDQQVVQRRADQDLVEILALEHFVDGG